MKQAATRVMGNGLKKSTKIRALFLTMSLVSVRVSSIHTFLRMLGVQHNREVELTWHEAWHSRQVEPAVHAQTDPWV